MQYTCINTGVSSANLQTTDRAHFHNKSSQATCLRNAQKNDARPRGLFYMYTCLICMLYIALYCLRDAQENDARPRGL